MVHNIEDAASASVSDVKNKEKLVPLEAQLAFTDELIDGIVYRLYGLTQEEIQLVKQNSRK